MGMQALTDYNYDTVQWVEGMAGSYQELTSYYRYDQNGNLAIEGIHGAEAEDVNSKYTLDNTYQPNTESAKDPVNGEYVLSSEGGTIRKQHFIQTFGQDLLDYLTDQGLVSELHAEVLLFDASLIQSDGSIALPKFIISLENLDRNVFGYPIETLVENGDLLLLGDGKAEVLNFSLIQNGEVVLNRNRVKLQRVTYYNTPFGRSASHEFITVFEDEEQSYRDNGEGWGDCTESLFCSPGPQSATHVAPISQESKLIRKNFSYETNASGKMEVLGFTQSWDGYNLEYGTLQQQLVLIDGESKVVASTSKTFSATNIVAGVQDSRYDITYNDPGENLDGTADRQSITVHYAYDAQGDLVLSEGLYGSGSGAPGSYRTYGEGTTEHLSLAKDLNYGTVEQSYTIIDGEARISEVRTQTWSVEKKPAEGYYFLEVGTDVEIEVNGEVESHFIYFDRNPDRSLSPKEGVQIEMTGETVEPVVSGEGDNPVITVYDRVQYRRYIGDRNGVEADLDDLRFEGGKGSEKFYTESDDGGTVVDSNVSRIEDGQLVVREVRYYDENFNEIESAPRGGNAYLAYGNTIAEEVSNGLSIDDSDSVSVISGNANVTAKFRRSGITFYQVTLEGRYDLNDLNQVSKNTIVSTLGETTWTRLVQAGDLQEVSFVKVIGKHRDETSNNTLSFTNYTYDADGNLEGAQGYSFSRSWTADGTLTGSVSRQDYQIIAGEAKVDTVHTYSVGLHQDGDNNAQDTEWLNGLFEGDFTSGNTQTVYNTIATRVHQRVNINDHVFDLDENHPHSDYNPVVHGEQGFSHEYRQVNYSYDARGNLTGASGTGKRMVQQQTENRHTQTFSNITSEYVILHGEARVVREHSTQSQVITTELRTEREFIRQDDQAREFYAYLQAHPNDFYDIVWEQSARYKVTIRYSNRGSISSQSVDAHSGSETTTFAYDQQSGKLVARGDVGHASAAIITLAFRIKGHSTWNYITDIVSADVIQTYESDARYETQRVATVGYQTTINGEIDLTYEQGGGTVVQQGTYSSEVAVIHGQIRIIRTYQDISTEFIQNRPNLAQTIFTFGAVILVAAFTLALTVFSGGTTAFLFLATLSLAFTAIQGGLKAVGNIFVGIGKLFVGFFTGSAWKAIGGFFEQWGKGIASGDALAVALFIGVALAVVLPGLLPFFANFSALGLLVLAGAGLAVISDILVEGFVQFGHWISGAKKIELRREISNEYFAYTEDGVLTASGGAYGGKDGDGKTSGEGIIFITNKRGRDVKSRSVGTTRTSYVIDSKGTIRQRTTTTELETSTNLGAGSVETPGADVQTTTEETLIYDGAGELTAAHGWGRSLQDDSTYNTFRNEYRIVDGEARVIGSHQTGSGRDGRDFGRKRFKAGVTAAYIAVLAVLVVAATGGGTWGAAFAFVGGALSGFAWAEDARKGATFSTNFLNFAFVALSFVAFKPKAPKQDGLEAVAKNNADEGIGGTAGGLDEGLEQGLKEGSEGLVSSTARNRIAQLQWGRAITGFKNTSSKFVKNINDLLSKTNSTSLKATLYIGATVGLAYFAVKAVLWTVGIFIVKTPVAIVQVAQKVGKWFKDSPENFRIARESLGEWSGLRTLRGIQAKPWSRTVKEWTEVAVLAVPAGLTKAVQWLGDNFILKGAFEKAGKNSFEHSWQRC